MCEKLPLEIQKCFELGALRLGQALEVLEWPSGGKDAPPPEINALFNVMFYLGSLPKPFQIYSEGACRNGRIDLMGYNGETAIAIEAKAFGAINRQAEAALIDLDRLRSFTPALTTGLRNNLQPIQWWQEAKSRWGIILISSFRGRAVADAWISQSDEQFKSIMSRDPNVSELARTDATGAPIGFFKLYKEFEHTNRGATLITTAERWKDCGQGWFLWGAIPL